MLTTINNRHHSKLPPLGSIGYITNGTNEYGNILYWQGKRQKWQVIAYPLNDNIAPYSYGIHTFFAKNLRTGEIKRFSGFYFDEVA